MTQVLALPSQLSPLLKAARKRARLSQEELAGRVGISQSRMSHMELNPGSISLEQLLALFGALDLELVVGARPSAAALTYPAFDSVSQPVHRVAEEPGFAYGGKTEW